MDKRYVCPKCGYEASADERSDSPECPRCGALLNEERGDGTPTVLDKVREAARGRLNVERVSSNGQVVSVDLGSTEPDYDAVRSAFSPMGYDAFARERNGRYYAFLVERHEEGKGTFSRPIVYIGLFIATVLSTIYAGYTLSLPLVEEGLMDNVWNGALSFSFGLLAILGCHEMGHKIQSIRSGIDSSWPYFIPMPFLPLGTLGALIKMKSAIPTNDDAIKVGAAGPLIGVAVAIPVTIIGMRLSYIVPGSAFGEGSFTLGSSLLFMALSELSISVPQGMNVWIHPLAFAGWVGLFVTMLNLLPAGQLDGGHVTRAIFGQRGHQLISKLVVRVLMFIGILGLLSESGFLNLGQYTWSGWLIWGFIAYFITRGGHPGPLNELKPLSTTSRVIGILALVTFILCFVPVPIQIA
ncbi:site-2 protease family protein [archaeon]|nr:MAG: site-2 protease family protein [archaeon]